MNDNCPICGISESIPSPDHDHRANFPRGPIYMPEFMCIRCGKGMRQIEALEDPATHALWCRECWEYHRDALCGCGDSAWIYAIDGRDYCAKCLPSAHP